MTLIQFINEIGRICLEQKNVRSFGTNDLYQDLAKPDIKYALTYVTQNQHQTRGEFDIFNINLFYLDRQQDVDGSNSLQIQSVGKEVLENVITTFNNLYGAEIYGTIYWQPFIQAHPDLLSGIYAIVMFQVPKAAICED